MTSLRLMNILAMAITAVVVILPSQLDAYYTQNTGCYHNGTWYADKSLVPTTEKCLNCQCTKKTLVCRLKVCPEMPMPPPRGCVVVQKKNTCCPYLSCARLDAFYKIPATRRIIAYLDHYERESIDRVVNDNMLQRRSDDTDVDLYVCVKNGTVYKSGSAMSSSNLCTYCYCIGGTEKCVKPKCMLPLEGCKPIFVDSTCCPVRYDCSTKQTGKSSQEVRYRKTANKHYLRMSQRLQRNRGCTVGSQFYAEGQKMKSDKDKPCDICFCIRGQRKCAPKKCAPALRNCIPVVPKGQCCPSSYDCGSQRDYRRSQNSRQFNLFSLLFGKDEEEDQEASPSEIAVQYPPDRHPEVVEKQPMKTKPPGEVVVSTTEKSIFDTLREGLEFIDNNNNNQMLKDNMDLTGIQPSPTPIPLGSIAEKPSSTTEISLLDLLLGPSEINAEENSAEEAEPEEKTTPSSSTTGISWVDLLLAPDDDDLRTSSTVSDKIDVKESSTVQDLTDFDDTTSTGTTTIDRLDRNNVTDDGEEEDDLGVFKAEDQDKLYLTTTDAMDSTMETESGEETTQTLPTTLSETTELTNVTTKRPITTESTTAKLRVELKTEMPTTKSPPKLPVKNITTKPEIKPDNGPDLLSVLLDGLSGILSSDKPPKNFTKPDNQTSLKLPPVKIVTNNLPSPKPLPFFKPLPTDKTYSRINSKIANLTVKPPMISTKILTNSTFKPLPPHLSKNPIIPISESLLKEDTSTSSTTAATTTSNTSPTTVITTTSTTTSAPPTITTSTLKPVVIKTNPTILEAEPLDQNTDHTLPPSLPNLKIIPFLPTDAVKADHNKPPSYDFYHHGSGPTSRIDYDQYDDANLYPSITEKYPLYPDLEDGSKAEYIYKFNVEGPDSLVSSPPGKFDGTLGSPAFVKYDFSAANLQPPKGFSPPTKTEGGFVPKDPLILDDDHDNVSVNVGDSYQVTQHIIDITTSADVLNTTKVIEITTPDPFKDVIRTELPPDLTSLIEDKLKNLITQSNYNSTIVTTTQQPSKENVQISFDMNVEEQSVKATASAAEAHFHNVDLKATNTMTDIGDNSKKVTQDMSDKQTTTGKTTANNHAENAMNKSQTEEHQDDDEAEKSNDGNSTMPKAGDIIKYMPEENSNTKTDGSTLTGTGTTAKPIDTAKQTTLTTSTTATTTITTKASKRPVIKHNNNKTIAHATSTSTSTTTANNANRPNLKLTKNKVSVGQPSATATETKILASSAVSTKTKSSNATRRVTSNKPTRQHYHNKPNSRPTNIPVQATKMANATANAAKGSSAQHRLNGTNIESQSSGKNTKRTGAVTVGALPNSSATKTTTTATTRRTSLQTKAPPPTTSSPSPPTTTTTTNPFLMSPFDKLPFMDASFEVKRNSATPSFAIPSQTFLVANGPADDGLPYFSTSSGTSSSSSSENPYSLSSAEHISSVNHAKLMAAQHHHPSFSTSSSSTTSTTTTTSHGHVEVSTSLPSRSSATLNNLIDPIGILKLAGCNIYGRMYRVGRIILELSSPCQECRCTEIGVKCSPLEC
ncbi:mucin-2 [Musca vetustissima]|uniref:mucin-2 n=1 Tax=Musca vetustissima TaxID=27455 RepID=UPI002AB66799|nr:mucin-2 [Musca vetustissima]